MDRKKTLHIYESFLSFLYTKRQHLIVADTHSECDLRYQYKFVRRYANENNAKENIGKSFENQPDPIEAERKKEK